MIELGDDRVHDHESDPRGDVHVGENSEAALDASRTLRRLRSGLVAALDRDGAPGGLTRETSALNTTERAAHDRSGDERVLRAREASFAVGQLVGPSLGGPRAELP